MSQSEIPSSPLTPLSSSPSPSLPTPTVGSTHPFYGLPSPNHDLAKKALNDLYGDLSEPSTLEKNLWFSIFHWLVLCGSRSHCKLHHEPSGQDTSVSFIFSHDLASINVQNSKSYHQTWPYLKLVEILGELETSNTPRQSDTATGTSVHGSRQPDASIFMTRQIGDNKWCAVSSVTEIKPSPDSDYKAKKGLAHGILYLLSAFASCGCWLGMAFHFGKFVRLVALDETTICVETKDEVVQGVPVSIREFLAGNKVRKRYIHTFGTTTMRDQGSLDLFIRFYEKSWRILLEQPSQGPLQPIVPPDESIRTEILDRFHIVTLSEDIDQRYILAIVRSAVKASYERKRRVESEKDEDGSGDEEGEEQNDRKRSLRPRKSQTSRLPTTAGGRTASTQKEGRKSEAPSARDILGAESVNDPRERVAAWLGEKAGAEVEEDEKGNRTSSSASSASIKTPNSPPLDGNLQQPSEKFVSRSTASPNHEAQDNLEDEVEEARCEISPGDAVGEGDDESGYDLPTCLEVLAKVRILLVTSEEMTRLIHG